MLNKELLMTGDNAPHGHILMTVGRSANSGVIGYNTYDRVGSVDRIPSWKLYGYPVAFDSLELRDKASYTTCYLTSNFQDPFPSKFHLTISVDGISRDFEFSSASYSDGIYMFDAFNLESKVGQTLAVTFDPPPRRLRTSTYVTFDLGIGYYAEEVPWEAQDAEQGTVNDAGRRRGVVDSTTQSHRGLLYRSNPSIEHQSAAYHLARNSEHGYCNGSNTSKEFPTTFTKCRTLQGHNRRWVYSRRLLQTRNSNHLASKQGVSRGVLRSVTYKEALYA